MLRSAVALAAIPVAWGALACAEEPRIEIGARLGSSLTDYRGETTTFVGVPATLYASFFVTPSIALEPQIGFHSMTAGPHSDHLLAGTFQGTYFFRGAARSSLAVLADATVAKNSYTDDETDLALGAGVGYRVPLRALAARFELQYRRYLRPAADALSISVAVGAVF